MPHTRVVVVPHYGAPEVITVIEEDIPTPNAGEVRVKVLAAGVSLPGRPGARGRPSRGAARALHAGVGSGRNS
jgi:NADPH:quinone reductase-like Zn-dependent oxidoreductase